MKIKPFEVDVYEDNDRISKEAVLQELRLQGYDVFENPNKYGIDLCIGQIEIERRIIWVGGTYPYDTVHVPLRKRKFFRRNISYVVVNRDLTHYLVIQAKDIVKSVVVSIPTRHFPEGEQFYDVPIDKCKIKNFTQPCKQGEQG